MARMSDTGRSASGARSGLSMAFMGQTQTLLEPHMQGLDPNPMEGSKPYGFEGPKGCLERLGRKKESAILVK